MAETGADGIFSSIPQEKNASVQLDRENNRGLLDQRLHFVENFFLDKKNEPKVEIKDKVNGSKMVPSQICQLVNQIMREESSPFSSSIQ